jgi:DNA-binding MarR family transcriptional regulator
MGSDPTACFIRALDDWTDIFARRSMHALVRSAHERGLSLSQIGTLFRLAHKDRLPVSEIGGELGVTAAAASQMLERLVKQGLVRREEDPSDRRVRRIELTEAGMAAVAEVGTARLKWFGSLAAAMDETELRNAAAALRLLTEKTRALEEAVP